MQSINYKPKQAHRTNLNNTPITVLLLGDMRPDKKLDVLVTAPGTSGELCYSRHFYLHKVAKSGPINTVYTDSCALQHSGVMNQMLDVTGRFAVLKSFHHKRRGASSAI